MRLCRQCSSCPQDGMRCRTAGRLRAAASSTACCTAAAAAARLQMQQRRLSGRCRAVHNCRQHVEQHWQCWRQLLQPPHTSQPAFRKSSTFALSRPSGEWKRGLIVKAATSPLGKAHPLPPHLAARHATAASCPGSACCRHPGSCAACIKASRCPGMLPRPRQASLQPCASSCRAAAAVGIAISGEHRQWVHHQHRQEDLWLREALRHMQGPKAPL